MHYFYSPARKETLVQLKFNFEIKIHHGNYAMMKKNTTTSALNDNDNYKIGLNFLIQSFKFWKSDCGNKEVAIHLDRRNMNESNDIIQTAEISRYLGCQVLGKHRQSWWPHQMEKFSALLALCAGIHRSPVNSPHTGQWRGALMFSLIYAWINGWVNNHEAGDWDAIVPIMTSL